MSDARFPWWQVKEDEDFCAEVLRRMEWRKKRLMSSKLHRAVQAAWAANYQRDKSGALLEFTGTKGEVVQLEPAVFRQKIQARLALIAQTPQDVEAIAENTDPESQAQCRLAVGVIKHYQSHAHLSDLRLERYEQALICAESYLHAPWDETKGEPGIASADGQGAMPEGDFTFALRSLYDVYFDSTSADIRRPREWIVREQINRWDALAKWPHLEEKLLTAEPYSRCWADWKYDSAMRASEDEAIDDSIAVYYVYGERSAAAPDGFSAVVLDETTIVEPRAGLGYKRAPVFPLIPSRVMFLPEGYSNHFGGLALAQARAGEISTIVSNHRQFGLLRAGIPRGANISKQHAMHGLAIFEYDHVNADGVPVPGPRDWLMGMPSTAAELFAGESLLAQLQDAVQGDSPVQRGDTAATKGDSGAKVAALFSASQQVAAPDVRALYASEQDLFNHIVTTLQERATTERVVMLAGQANEWTARKFKGSDIARVYTVRVRQPDPSRDSFQGRNVMAEILKGAKDPAERQMLSALMTTGNVDVMLDPLENARLECERENEQLRDPSQPIPEALKYDNHAEHLAKHFAEARALPVREDMALRDRFEQHCAAHIARLTPGHPEYAGDEILRLTGQQPLAPLGTPPGQGPNAQHDNTPPGAKGAPPPSNGKGGNGSAGKPPEGASTPGQAGMPENPATGERMRGAPPPPPVTGG